MNHTQEHTAVPKPPSPPIGLWRHEHVTRPLRLADLTDDLLWTKLLRAAPLALRPARIILAFFALLSVSLIWRLPSLWPRSNGATFLSDSSNSLGAAADAARIAWADGPLPALWVALSQFLFRVPLDLLSNHPVWTVSMVLLCLPVLAIGGGTISRMVACEFSQAFMLPWTEALALVFRRRNSLIGAAVAPLLIVGAIVLGLGVAGWILLNWPGVNVVGATFYPLFLAGGLGASIVLIGYVLGQCLLTPAVVCENTDAIDAMQRSYAYVISSPLRLLVYAAVLGVLGLIVGLSTEIASRGATLFTGAEATNMVRHAAQPGGTWNAGASVIVFWNTLFAAVLSSFALSFYFSASTILYILLRRLNDGQEPVEIWMPGLVPGTLSTAEPAERAAAIPDSPGAHGDDDR